MADIWLPRDVGDMTYIDDVLYYKVGPASALPTYNIDTDDTLDIQPITYNVADGSGFSAYSKLQNAVSAVKHGHSAVAANGSTIFYKLISYPGVLRVWGGKEKTIYVNGIEVATWGASPVVQADAIPIEVVTGDIVTFLNSSADAGTFNLDSSFLPYVFPEVDPGRIFTADYRIQNVSNNGVGPQIVIDQYVYENYTYTGFSAYNPLAIQESFFAFRLPKELLQGNKVVFKYKRYATQNVYVGLVNNIVDVSTIPQDGYSIPGLSHAFITGTANGGEGDVNYNVPDLSAYPAEVTLLFAMDYRWGGTVRQHYSYLKILDQSWKLIHDFDINNRVVGTPILVGNSSYGTFN